MVTNSLSHFAVRRNYFVRKGDSLKQKDSIKKKKQQKEHVLLYKLLYSFMTMLVYMVGRNIPLYGIDIDAYSNVNVDAQSILLQAISGDMKNCSIFIIGLWPYMLASMLAVLVVAIMSLDHTRKLSPKKINIWTVTIMMIIAAVQAYHKTQTLIYRVSGDELIWNKIIVFIQLIAGMLIVVYMCDRATKYGKICRRNYYDDRGFVSSTVIYENGIEQYQDFLMENGIWKIREYKNDGHVVVNQTCPDYDVVPDAKSGKAGEPVEMRFTKAEYDSLEAVIEEVFASYVNLTRQNDNFFVAMHPLHIRVAEHVLKGKRIIATFFENRFDFTQTSLAADFLEHAENIITDSDYTTKLIMENLGAVNNKPVRLNITDIPPYDTRMDFGISSQLRVQNILVPVDGLTEDAFARIIKGLADYLTINDLARVHFFTRDASWGHEDAIKNDTVKLLDSMGYDSRLVTGDGEAALGFGGSGADAFAENELGDIEKTVEQRFFVDVCVDERDISKCINEQRVILDMRGTMDVFVYVTAISKGVPRISLSADQFLVSGKNGMVIDDFSDIGRSLTYYLDSFENWNQALVECYELGQKYTTSVLLKKWRKVLNFSE